MEKEFIYVAERGRRESGFEVLGKKVTRFKEEEKGAVLKNAIHRKLYTVLEEAKMKVGLAIKALTEPLSDVEKLLEDLNNVEAEARREETRIFDLITGDHRRLREFLEEQASQLRKESVKYLEELICNSNISRDGVPGSMQLLRETVAETCSTVFRAQAG